MLAREILFTAIVLMMSSCDPTQAVCQYGYTIRSCDDFKPRRVETGEANCFQRNPSGNPSGRPAGSAPSGTRFDQEGALAPSPDGHSNQPVLMTTFSPYRIWVESNRYRTGAVMKVHLEGRHDWDGFIMEARALGGGPSSKLAEAGVGRWSGPSNEAVPLNCRNRPSSAVADAVSPRRLNNLTLEWEAPLNDVGDIFFIAGVLLDDRYWVITSDKLLPNPFLGELLGCGIRRTCVRLCGYDTSCTLEQAEYVLIIEIDRNQREATITIGGHLDNYYGYVGFGMSPSYYSLTDMDVTACMKERNGAVSVGHYYVKSQDSAPFPHNGIVVPDITDLDNDYIWCRFRIPLLNYGLNSISPNRPFYHFYFKGIKNQSGLFLPEVPVYQLNVSPRLINITDFYTDVQMYSAATRCHLLNVVSLLLPLLTLSMIPL